MKDAHLRAKRDESELPGLELLQRTRKRRERAKRETTSSAVAHRLRIVDREENLQLTQLMQLIRLVDAAHIRWSRQATAGNGRRR